MNLYDIKFKNGFTLQEYGRSEQDVREFLTLAYRREGEIESITQL